MGLLLSLKASDSYSIAVQSGRAAAHANGAARRPQAATGWTETEALNHADVTEAVFVYTRGKTPKRIIADRYRSIKAPRCCTKPKEELILSPHPSRLDSVGSVDAQLVCSDTFFRSFPKDVDKYVSDPVQRP